MGNNKREVSGASSYFEEGGGGRLGDQGCVMYVGGGVGWLGSQCFNRPTHTFKKNIKRECVCGGGGGHQQR